MRGRDVFQKIKPLINLLVRYYSVFPRGLRVRKMERLRKKTGKIALLKRYALLKTLAKRVGDNVAVFPDVYLQNVQELEIGSNVSFQPMTYIEAWGGVTIGDDVSFAQGASVFSVNHGFADVNTPIKNQPLTALPVTIESNVWVGSKATILGGTTVAFGTIVAAGAVVTKDTDRLTTVAGVPATVVKRRG